LTEHTGSVIRVLESKIGYPVDVEYCAKKKEWMDEEFIVENICRPSAM
jgi:hypothetical protein